MQFDRILNVVFALTLLCGAFAVAIAIVGAIVPVPSGGQLVSAFLDDFKLGMAAILGLIGGRSSRSSHRRAARRRNRDGRRKSGRRRERPDRRHAQS